MKHSQKASYAKVDRVLSQKALMDTFGMFSLIRSRNRRRSSYCVCLESKQTGEIIWEVLTGRRPREGEEQDPLTLASTPSALRWTQRRR